MVFWLLSTRRISVRLLLLFAVSLAGDIESAFAVPPAVAEKPRGVRESTVPPRNPVPVRTHDEDELTPEQQRQILILEWMTSVWFFALGATIGSFLNVVVHRLPLGIRLGHPKSRCPVCEVPIRRGDNLPIVGWLRLRGRCRSCGTRISVRYPIIEFSVGLLFLGLLHRELLTGGTNLPVRTPNTYANVLWVIWYTKWDLIGLFFYHAFLLSTLLVVALIQWDGHPIPRKFLWYSILAGIGFSTVWPHLHPVPFTVPVPNRIESLRWSVTIHDSIFSGWDHKIVGVSLQGFLDGAIGGFVGLACGQAIRQGAGWQRPTTETLEATPWVLSFVGAILGWQAVISILLLTAILLTTARLLGSRNSSAAFIAIGVSTALQVFWWRPLSDWPHWPGHQATSLENSVAMGVPVLLMVIWFRGCRDEFLSSQQKSPE